MEIINKTPHAIALTGTDGVMQIITPTGPAVRVKMSDSEQVDLAGCVPIHAAPTVQGITNLPARKPGTIFVVSQIAAISVAALHPDRDDVVYPGTGAKEKAERAQGKVLAVTRLIRAV